MAPINFAGLTGLKKNEILAGYTTFNIGGPADWFYEAKTEKDLLAAVVLARKNNLPWFILGGGSNLLVADEGFRGLVIAMRNTQCVIPASRQGGRDTKITADAGLPLAKIVDLATQNSLSGLEFAAGIPGTIGGAVRGNAGAWRQSVGEKVSAVKVADDNGQITWLDQKDCLFSYRESRFKKTGEIILAVELNLAKGNQTAIKNQVAENLAKRRCQPGQPSAGCIFKNSPPVSTGALIDQVGLKGRKIGGAQISPQHANFIVNLGKAKASDVIELIKVIKTEVKKKFGVAVKEEICLLGFGKTSLSQEQ